MTTTIKTAIVRARMEPSVKKKAEIVLRKIGLSPSEAINVFYRRVAREQGIPFSLDVPNSKTRAAMKEIRNGGGRVSSLGEFISEMHQGVKTDKIKQKSK